MTRIKVGKIIIPGGMTRPEQHEYDVANIFAQNGKDVQFIKPSRIQGSHSPDVKIDGVLWEMKSPTGKSKNTVQEQLKRASKQSKNIIFDSRRTKLSDAYVYKELHKQMVLSRSLTRLIIISKQHEIIEIKR